MARNEGNLIKRLAGKLERAKITRIESLASLGFPDCVIGFGDTGRFALVECKVITQGLAIDLRPHQISFHVAHAELGCPTWVLVEFWPRTKEKELRLYPGAQAIELKKQGMRLSAPHCWALDSVNWSELQSIIA